MTRSFDADEKVDQYRLRGERHEAKILQAMKGEFDRQRDYILGRIEITPMPAKGMKRKDYLDDVVDWSEFDEAMARALAPILLGIIAETGQFAMQQVALDPSLFNTFNQAIQDYYRGRSTKVSKSVNDETEKQLRAELSQGIQNGETTYEIRARIEKVFGFAATVRADRIARTETTTAQSFADIEAWDQSGVVEAKEWYCALDERVCSWCFAQHGKIVSLKKNYFSKGDVLIEDDKKLNIDYSDVIGPSLHVRCRCVLLPVLIDS